MDKHKQTSWSSRRWNIHLSDHEVQQGDLHGYLAHRKHPVEGDSNLLGHWYILIT